MATQSFIRITAPLSLFPLFAPFRQAQPVRPPDVARAALYCGYTPRLESACFVSAHIGSVTVIHSTGVLHTHARWLMDAAGTFPRGPTPPIRRMQVGERKATLYLLALPPRVVGSVPAGRPAFAACVCSVEAVPFGRRDPRPCPRRADAIGPPPSRQGPRLHVELCPACPAFVFVCDSRHSDLRTSPFSGYLSGAAAPLRGPAAWQRPCVPSRAGTFLLSP